MTGIYQIQSKIKPNRSYIGSAVNIKKRWNYHREDLRKNKHINSRLQNHHNKYGISDLKFSILTGCSKDDLIKNEQFFIDAYNPFFNICKTAGSPLGRKCTPETIIKLRISHLGNTSNKGKKWSLEARKKCSERQTGKKRPHSEQWKEKNRGPRINMRGRKLSDEHKKKISINNLGRKPSPEAIKNMCLAQTKYYQTHPGTRLGVSLSEETKHKMSLAMSNYYKNKRNATAQRIYFI